MKACIGHTPYYMSTAVAMHELRSMQIMATFLLCSNVTTGLPVFDRYDKECDFALMSIELCWAYTMYFAWQIYYNNNKGNGRKRWMCCSLRLYNTSSYYYNVRWVLQTVGIEWTLLGGDYISSRASYTILWLSLSAWICVMVCQWSSQSTMLWL